MAKVSLIKKQYLGDGSCHVFRNNTTGTDEYFPCTNEEYASLAIGSGIKPCQIKEGYTYLRSLGGKPVVDNPDGELKEGEYIDYVTENGVQYGKISFEGKLLNVFFKEGEVVDDKFETDLIKINSKI